MRVVWAVSVLLAAVTGISAIVAPLNNGDFEDGYTGWTWSALADMIYCGTEFYYPNHGDCYLWLGGINSATDIIWQEVDLRGLWPPVQFKVCWAIQTAEINDVAYDFASLSFIDPATLKPLAVVETWDNTNADDYPGYYCRWHIVDGVAGRVVRLELKSRTDVASITNFYFDDLLLLADDPYPDPTPVPEHQTYLPLTTTGR